MGQQGAQFSMEEYVFSMEGYVPLPHPCIYATVSIHLNKNCCTDSPWFTMEKDKLMVIITITKLPRCEVKRLVRFVCSLDSYKYKTFLIQIYYLRRCTWELNYDFQNVGLHVFLMIKVMWSHVDKPSIYKNTQNIHTHGVVSTMLHSSMNTWNLGTWASWERHRNVKWTS